MIIDNLRDIVKTTNAELDVSAGSPLSDLLVGPMAMILQSLQDQNDQIVSTLSLNDVTLMADADLDDVAANFLQTRSPGGVAIGSVVFLYEAPQTVSIPKGTVLTFGDMTVITSAAYSISSGTMNNNIGNYPYYSTGAITVVAEAAGAKYNFPAGTIFTTTITPAPKSVTNLAVFVGGSEPETNEQFYKRFMNNAKNFNAGTPDGVAAILYDKFPTIKNVAVYGAGHVMMDRDMVLDRTNLVNSRGVIDFFGKVKGIAPVDYAGLDVPAHTAFVGTFPFDDTDVISASNTAALVQLPSPDDLAAFPQPENELSTYDYITLYTKATDATATSNYLVLEDSFDSTSLTDWELVDMLNDAAGIVDSNEIRIKMDTPTVSAGGRISNKVVLGHTQEVITSLIITASDIEKFARYIGIANKLGVAPSAALMT